MQVQRLHTSVRDPLQISLQFFVNSLLVSLFLEGSARSRFLALPGELATN